MLSEDTAGEASSSPSYRETDLRVGDVVVDREREGKAASEGVVINVPSTAASDWDVREGRRTLAQEHPDYPADSQAACIAFAGALRRYLDRAGVASPATGSPISLGKLNDDPLQFYSFPAARLRATGEQFEYDPLSENSDSPSDDAADSDPTTESASHDDEADAATEAALDSLATQLEDSGLRVTEQDTSAGVLIVSKLGQTYRITPEEGVIEGEGAFRDRIDQVVLNNESA